MNAAQFKKDIRIGKLVVRREITARLRVDSGLFFNPPTPHIDFHEYGGVAHGVRVTYRPARSEPEITLNLGDLDLALGASDLEALVRERWSYAHADQPETELL